MLLFDAVFKGATHKTLKDGMRPEKHWAKSLRAHLAVADKLAAVVRAHFQHDYDYMMYR